MMVSTVSAEMTGGGTSSDWNATPYRSEYDSHGYPRSASGLGYPTSFWPRTVMPAKKYNEVKDVKSSAKKDNETSENGGNRRFPNEKAAPADVTDKSTEN